MKTREEKRNDALVLFMEGEINIGNSPELRKIFEEVVKRNEKKVLVDFAAVSYIDSSGLATLIEVFQRLKKIGGNLRLCSMDAKIRNIFEITKLHKVFNIFDSQDAALKEF
ncbi:MAG: STAS domain-containing protein [Candidatus Omnitrophica bacterium]|nr:STAS domain-containing protein [Candidatus Omnitrophota bacterium]